MSGEEVVIAGHRAVRGTKAHTVLMAADLSAHFERVQYAAGREASAERFAALVGKNIEHAKKCDGYLGPTLPTPNPDALETR